MSYPLLNKKERINKHFYQPRYMTHDEAKVLYDRIGIYVELKYYNSISLRDKFPRKDKIKYVDFVRWLSYNNITVVNP